MGNKNKKKFKETYLFFYLITTNSLKTLQATAKRLEAQYKG